MDHSPPTVAGSNTATSSKPPRRPRLPGLEQADGRDRGPTSPWEIRSDSLGLVPPPGGLSAVEPLGAAAGRRPPADAGSQTQSILPSWRGGATPGDRRPGPGR